MAVPGGDVHQTGIGDQVDPAAVGHLVAHDVVALFGLFDRQPLQGRHIDLNAEMTGVGQHHPVFHLFDMTGIDHVATPCGGHEDVAMATGLLHLRHRKTLHGRFDRFDRIDLTHCHERTHALGPHGDSLAAPTVPDHHDLLAGHQQVGRPVDRVPHRLTGAVAVIEQMFAVGTVDGNDRQAQQELFLERHGPQHTGGGFLAHTQDPAKQLGADGMQAMDQIPAVIDDDMGSTVQHLVDVLQIGLVRSAMMGVDPQPISSQCRGSLVTGGQRIASGDGNLCPTGSQHGGQVGCLGFEVDRDSHTHTGKRLAL